MKKDIFTIWLKEFCSLVFTQAVQAFLLAAIMSVVIATASGNITSNQGAAASATGIIAIIALTAISKIELLVKKLFGIESQFGDPSMKNGMAGLAGTLIGAKLAGRVLNNVGKIGGGIRDMGRAKNEKAKLQGRLARDLNKLNKAQTTEDPNAAGGVAGAAVGSAAGGAAGGVAGGVAGGTAGDGSANGGNATLTPNSLTINAGTVNLDGKQSNGGSNSYQDKLDEIRDKYDDEIRKVDAQRRAGAYKILSGATESVGGIAGGIVGATVGAATGDGVFQKAGIGMGVGDFVGETAAKTVRTVHETRIDMKYEARDKDKTTKAISDLTGKDIDNYRKAVKELEKYTSKLGDATKNVDAGNM